MVGLLGADVESYFLEVGEMAMNAYCPICGRSHEIKLTRQRKCPQASLDAIDRSRKSEHDHRENKKPFSQRLADGFELMQLPYNEDDGE